MMRRMSFNGGEISPDLHWRCDLERFFSSCRTIDNFLVKPSGAVTRRPPTVALAQVFNPGRDTFITARMFAFKYSEDTVYIIVVTQSAEACTITVYDTDGVVKGEISDAPWSELNLYEISFQKSNDVLFLAHSNVPIGRLERHGDDDWQFVAHEFRGGPWRSMNLDQTAVISLTVPRWSAAATYAVGDIVDNFDCNFTITAVGHEYWKKTKINVENDNSGAEWNTTKKKITIDQYYTVLTVASTTGLSVGNRIEVSGTAYHNGTYEVLKLTSTKVYINTGAAKYAATGATKNWYATESLGASSFIHYDDGTFYECIQAHAPHHHTDETDYWREVHSYNGSVTLTCHAGIFSENMVGTRIRIDCERPESYLRGTFLADGSSKAFPVTGKVSLTSGGRWSGNMDLELSTDNGANWDSIAQISSNDADYNGVVERDIDEQNALIRVTMSNYDTPTRGKGATWKLTIETKMVPVIVTLSHYTSATQMEGEVEASMFLTETTWRWYEGAFGPKHGYPRAICIFDERLMCAGTTTDPHRIFGSAINDWQDFAPGTLETSPIDFAVASDSLQKIMWLCPKQELLVGTDGGEYTVAARDSDKAISGSNIRVKRQAEHGSAPIQAVATAEAVAYVQRARRAIRMCSYEYQSDGYVSLDMSTFAQHLVDGSIRELTYQRVPNGVLWTVRNDGTLLSLTYNREQQVMGWGTHHTWDDGFVCAACAPGVYSDDVYVLCQRGERVYLEKLEELTVTGPDTATHAQTNTSWLDWRHTVDGDGVKDVDTVTLLPAPSAVALTWPLQVYGDGRLLASDEYSIAYSSEVGRYQVKTISQFYRIDVGLPYTSTVKPTDIAVNPQVGTAAGDTFRVSEVQLYLVDSIGGEVSLDDGETFNAIPWLTPATIPGRALQPQTAMKRQAITGGHRRGLDLVVRTSNAGPFTLAMVAAELEKVND